LPGSIKDAFSTYKNYLRRDLARYAHTTWFKGVLKEFDRARYSFLFWTIFIALFVPPIIAAAELVMGSYDALWKIAASEVAISYLFIFLITKKNTAVVSRIVLIFMPIGYLLAAYAPRTHGTYAIILVSLPLILSNLVIREKKILAWIAYYMAAIVLGFALPLFGLTNNWRLDYDTKTVALFHVIAIMVTFVANVMSFGFLRILYGAIDRFLRDETTGLPSIHVFHEDVRDHDRFIAGILRIGNFKEITTLFGYEFSEAILIETASKLKEYLATHGAAAYRLNNYDFGFIMPIGPEGDDESQARVRILYQQLQGPVSCHGKNIEPVYHIGYAVADEGGKDSCLNEADLALKRGIEEHEPVVAYSDAIDDRLKTEAMIGQLLILSRNIKEGKLAAYHQRIVALCAPDGQAWSESLLRIWDFQSEYRAPGPFLPLLRSTGYERDISDFMVDHAERCVQDNPGWLSINVTSRDLSRSGFMAQACRVARLSAERGGRFILELLESDIMGARDDVLPALNDFRQAGGLVAMDDFGSGYSNFGKLLSFPLDIVKFDGEFVRMSYVNATARSLLERVARSLAEAGILTVAEFVETEEQARMLREMGINYGQGFLWSKPSPAYDEEYSE
jgi:EAL domain-containing protein (putative c-di-GMP-specific phosphodiesterase class I)/GGDEF domain-containing protein